MPKASTVTIAPAVLQSYAGRYRSESNGVTVTIALDGTQLRSIVPNQPPGTLIPVSETEFKMAEVDGVRFAFAGRGGMIERVIVTQNNTPVAYERVTAETTAGGARRSGGGRWQLPARRLRQATAAAAAPAAAAVSAEAMKPAPRARREAVAGIPWRQRRGQWRRAGRDRHLERRAGHERPLEDADPRHLQLQPDRLGQPHLRHHRDQQQRRQDVQDRALRRRRAGRGRLAARVEDLRPRSRHRQDPLGADRVQRHSQGEASHQGQPGELHARHRRQARGRRVRLDRPARRLGHRRQAALEDRPRRARQRLVPRSGVSVGTFQLADHLQGHGDRAGRSAERLVHRRLRSEDRQAGLAHRSRRRNLDVGHADAVPRGRARNRSSPTARRSAATIRPPASCSGRSARIPKSRSARRSAATA